MTSVKILIWSSHTLFKIKAGRKAKQLSSKFMPPCSAILRVSPNGSLRIRYCGHCGVRALVLLAADKVSDELQFPGTNVSEANPGPPFVIDPDYHPSHFDS